MHHFKRGFGLSFILIIAAAAILAGGAYCYVQNTYKPVQTTATLQTATSTTAITTTSQTPTQNPVAVSVHGMSKYTDSSFGFSFWYPISGSVSITPDSFYSSHGTTVSGWSTYMYGPNTSIVKSIEAPEFTIDEVYSPNMSILDAVDAGPFGSDTDKYFFNPSLHTWMEQTDGGPRGGPGGTGPADTSNNTMGGLHILYGYTRFAIKVIIPLSAQHFLAIYSKCNDASDYLCNENDTSVQSAINKFKTSIQTIVATDPLVATPVSAAQQTATIQAEAAAYAGQ
jgi:hypothetical protein